MAAFLYHPDMGAKIMADEAAVETTDAATAATDTAEPDWKAEADKWKAMARKHEGTAKQNADAAKRLAEIEEAQKTAEQKAAEKAATTERERDAAKVEALRLSVAIDKGLTKVQAKRLVGSTEEELAADADELLASFARPAEEKPEVTAVVRPKEALKSGSTAAAVGDVVQLTADDVARLRKEGRHAEIVKAKEEGRLNTLLGIK